MGCTVDPSFIGRGRGAEAFDLSAEVEWMCDQSREFSHCRNDEEAEATVVEAADSSSDSEDSSEVDEEDGDDISKRRKLASPSSID